MGSRRKFNAHRKQKKKQNKFERPRKTYSLYGSKKKDKHIQQTKRKPEPEELEINSTSKKFKAEEILQQPEEMVSSESEEELDYLAQLRLTFNNVRKDNEAIESSDETEESDIEENHNVGEGNMDEDGDEEAYDNTDDDDTIAEDNLDMDPEEIPDTLDPFAKHLFYELHENFLQSIQPAFTNVQVFNEEWPHIGNLVLQLPQFTEHKQEKKQDTVLEEKQYAAVGQIPKRICTNKDTLQNLFIKTQIINNIAKSNISLVNKDKVIPLTGLQSELFSVINNYQDLYYPQRTFDNSEEIRYVYCLHAINHILKTRTKVVHHNVRLSNKDDVPEDFRDQGLVRPKVLIIVPFKDAAYKIIQFLINILITEDKGNVINKNRFLEDFTGNELSMPKKNPKPEDYELTFTGNSSDDFKIGITVTKKSLKLYADFYSSDIIISSPLGLRYTIGAEGEPERDYDFLASIELLIFDQMEIFLMQNWDHVLHIMKHMHLQPKESHGTDFARVRTWSLNGWAKYYRQTLIFSSQVLPEINAIFNKYCFNYAGKAKVIPKIQYGSIRQVYVQLPHVFQKINADNVEHSIDARFAYFTRKVLPQQRDALMKQTAIYISSYFDYVKIRNYFKKEDISFVQICEYSKDAKIARARDMFFHGDAHFLLYTERHHFFNRIKIKGIRHLIFYQPPNFPHFYYEICNFMQEANMNKKIGNMSNMTVTVLYTKYDAQQLAAIVGTDRAAKMLQSEQHVHMLVTDGN